MLGTAPFENPLGADTSAFRPGPSALRPLCNRAIVSAVSGGARVRWVGVEREGGGARTPLRRAESRVLAACPCLSRGKNSRQYIDEAEERWGLDADR
jgi:hypothetical protein